MFRKRIVLQSVSLVLILALAIFLSTVAANAGESSEIGLLPAITSSKTPELTVGDTTGTPGTMIEVPVNLVSAGEAVAFQFELSYDPYLLTYQQTNAGSLTGAPFIVSANLLPDNDDAETWPSVKVIIMNFTNSPVASGSGTIALLQFQVAATAPANKSCPMVLSGVTLSDTHGQSITTYIHDGLFTLLQPPGDMNGDYTVNILDSLIMANHLGETMTSDSPGVDFNKDGVVNILDLIAVEKLY